jgi:hypothetical protein
MKREENVAKRGGKTAAENADAGKEAKNICLK